MSFPSNCRLISLTSIICKLLEHVVYSSVLNFLDSSCVIFSDFLHAFRQRRSYETQLINTVGDLSICLDKSSHVDAILLGFSKAFDKVDHSSLLMKMYNYGIQCNLFNLSASFLQDCIQHIFVDGALSDPLPVLFGVPHGTVLCVLIFLIYINDIHIGPGT